MRTLKDRQNLNEREILRYLGYKSGQEVDARTLQLIAQEEEELFRTAEFRSVYRIFPIRQVTEDAVDFGFTCIHSRNLAKNLKGCGQAGISCGHAGQRGGASALEIQPAAGEPGGGAPGRIGGSH